MEILTWDIETLKKLFLASFWDPVKDEWYEFEISHRKNDIYALAKFLKERKDIYFVGFNNVKFDAQVIEYILRQYKGWYDLTNEEIVLKIYKKSQDIIRDINYGDFPPYRESEITNPQIDVFKILHFDNPARSSSLKWCEFSGDAPEIEVMPVAHDKENMTNKEIEDTIYYCRNDIKSTYLVYKYVTGNIDHSFYKGKNKIQDRLDIMELYGFNEECLNYSDVKIGDEVNKKGYLELTGYDNKKLWELKKNRKPTPKFTFGDCIPHYVTFQTKEFQKLYNEVNTIKVSLGSSKQEFNFTYNGTKYTIGRGGIHSCEKNVIIKPLENELLVSFDISSQYPSAIIKRGLYPSHLGKKWLVNYKKQLLDRLDNKAKSKDKSYSEEQRRIFSSKEKTGKLSVNGAFGKLNDKTSWQYDPYSLHKCTIGNQFEMLMLIETLELAGIHIVSANTDGCEVLFDKSLESKFYEICHAWEAIVGNTEIGKLEFEQYQAFYKESVNHYIAVTTEGKVKIKGRFDVDVELHKNNTDKIGRIERLAIQDYFIKGTPIEDTIKGCTEIFKFCIGMKASRDYKYITTNPVSYKQEEYSRVIRFFISKKGVRLYKVKKEDSDATGSSVTKICGEHTVTMFNKSYHIENFSDYNIDYDFYIARAQDIVDKIERGSKRKTPHNKLQLSLF